MRRLSLTPEVRARLEREAEIRAQETTYKQLETETGLSANYIANVVGKMIRKKRSKCELSIVGTAEPTCQDVRP